MPAQAPVQPRRKPQHYAVVGAGIAGIVCARTLAQAGHRVSVFEQAARVGGRTLTLQSPAGGFDAGAQYFTVRDERFARALQTVPGLCRPWSASTVRVLDGAGRVVSAAPPPGEAHWVAQPGMDALAAAWAEPLAQLHTGRQVGRLKRLGARWRLQTVTGPDAQDLQDAGSFDALLLALPAPEALTLLRASGLRPAWAPALAQVRMAPCWTLMLSFAQAVRPGLTTLGPQWNAARSTHHRVAWLARESSKPARAQVERWTVQASPAWSEEHRMDGAQRVQDKLLKAFAEITGIRATPSAARALLWPHAQTQVALGQSFVWDKALHLGACGDWCLGHRLEDAFVSGLELALAVAT
ncbi:NAD(P)/FAD-dependent oxidoreductase [Comamonas flocculans]|uniref:FAD-binding protein n=1 Tax=Comamonas flocculans TaxID=2597701 RepID=A0A5B8S136_9BURK|nr:FAD-dependent oxidoreductase [Comamonas flocculans]QEA14217.1 FAD-binding protein [Comamonas flocculans]